MIMGYGVCGPDITTRKHMRKTLDEFKRICDRVIIVANRINDFQYALIKNYGFEIYNDDREWGVYQWRIKEDFIKKFIPKIKPDYLLCLDMDEVFYRAVSGRELVEMLGDNIAGYFYFVYMRNDENHYNPNYALWNVRFWQYRPELSLDWEKKSLHCGLAPKVYYELGIRLPVIIKHYGLFTEEERREKTERYKKYDPEGKQKSTFYYQMIQKDTETRKIDWQELEKEVKEFIKNNPEKSASEKLRIKYPVNMKKNYYVRNPHGLVVIIGESHLNETLARDGFELLGEVTEKRTGVEETSSVVGKVELPVVETSVKKEPYECEFCGFVAKNQGGLQLHKRKHKDSEL